MKKLTVFITAMVLVGFSHAGFAKEPAEFTEAFFSMLKTGKISEAYDQLFVGSPVPAQKPQALEMIKRQTASALPLFGKIVGVEKIRDERIGESIVRLVYVLKLDRSPTVWEFYFYKPKNSWFLVNVNFNDEFKLLQKVE